MAWQRKIPFGYMIRGGVIQPHPQEADAVRYIFGQYLAGASLLTVAEEMTMQGIRYHQHTAQWNKCMVKRILENRKYTGADGWPRLVSDEDLAAVQRQKSDRNTYAPLDTGIQSVRGKTVCAQCGGRMARGTRSHGRIQWKCQDPDCGQSVCISDEVLALLVDKRLRAVAQAPHMLTPPEPQRAEPSIDTIRLQNELTMAFNRGAEKPEYIKALILSAAAQRYAQLPDPTPAHELERLRGQLERGPADAGAVAGLLTTAVRAIRLTPDKKVEVELINGAIITEEKEVQGT